MDVIYRFLYKYLLNCSATFTTLPSHSDLDLEQLYVELIGPIYIAHTHTFEKVHHSGSSTVRADTE